MCHRFLFVVCMLFSYSAHSEIFSYYSATVIASGETGYRRTNGVVGNTLGGPRSLDFSRLIFGVQSEMISKIESSGLDPKQIIPLPIQRTNLRTEAKGRFNASAGRLWGNKSAREYSNFEMSGEFVVSFLLKNPSSLKANVTGFSEKIVHSAKVVILQKGKEGGYSTIARTEPLSLGELSLNGYFPEEFENRRRNPTLAEIVPRNYLYDLGITVTEELKSSSTHQLELSAGLLLEFEDGEATEILELRDESRTSEILSDLKISGVSRLLSPFFYIDRTKRFISNRNTCEKALR